MPDSSNDPSANLHDGDHLIGGANIDCDTLDVDKLAERLEYVSTIPVSLSAYIHLSRSWQLERSSSWLKLMLDIFGPTDLDDVILSEPESDVDDSKEKLSVDKNPAGDAGCRTRQRCAHTAAAMAAPCLGPI
jgi:hypothetical protein